MQFFSLLAVFVGGEIVEMLSNTGAVAKLVLLALLAFSLISWAIILTKWSLLRRARAQSGRFVRAFRKAQRLQDIAAVADQFKPSPLVGVFEGGYEEYKRQVEPPVDCETWSRSSVECRSARRRRSRVSSAICRGLRSRLR